jgi:hypothetical protein
LEGRYPYLFLHAKVEKVRDGGRVVNKALVIAHGVHETGRREIVSIDVGEAETEAFGTDFLRGLVARGLVGVRLAISDAHGGLKATIAKVLGCAWQRCPVHFLRDCLGHARKDQHGLRAALIRPIFNADSPAQGRDRLSEAVAHLDGRLEKVAAMLEDAEPDILAFYAFPAGALAQAAVNESARALQQGDRPAHRRRRHLPRRPEPHPPRRDAPHRAERRVARRARLPLGRVDLHVPRTTSRSHRQRDQGANGTTPDGLSSHKLTDDTAPRSYTTSGDLTAERTVTARDTGGNGAAVPIARWHAGLPSAGGTARRPA